MLDINELERGGEIEKLEYNRPVYVFALRKIR